MKLLTKANLKSLPALGSQGEVEDPIAHVKFFGGGAATWYCMEFDGEDRFFGFVDLFGDPNCAELGYFSLAELKSLKFPPFGLPIERDMYYDPEPLSKIRERHSA